MLVFIRCDVILVQISPWCWAPADYTLDSLAQVGPDRVRLGQFRAPAADPRRLVEQRYCWPMLGRRLALTHREMLARSARS
jgi:hypothetical protein